jgi:catechol 2,3-dioxygenase-like lactoylglutathione lyase family enzyme
MKVTRTLHHSVNVEGHLAETTAFYQRLLGLADDDRPTIPGIDGHWFGTGAVQLHLVDADAGPGPIRPAGPHVCFAVTDLDAAIAELDQAGIPYVEGAQGTTVQIWFTDPAGNTVEIQQDTGIP